jgi:putative aldouronate transport system substrate-binding protein
MNKKVLISLMILIVTIMGSLTGCGTTAEKEEEDFLPIEEELDLEPTVLTFYMPAKEKKDTKEVLDMVAKASDLNITLNFKWFDDSEYTYGVTSAIAGNVNFDAFLCGRPERGGLNFVDLFREKKIKDISESFPKYAPTIFSQLSQEEVAATRIDGKVAAVPSLLPKAKLTSVLMRQDLAEKYDISSIKTFEDYTAALKKIKDGEGDIIPGIIADYNIDVYAGAYGYVVLDYSQNLVYKQDDPQMKIVPWEQTPEFRESVMLIDKWYKEGYIKPVNRQVPNSASYMFKANSFVEGLVEVDLTGKGKQTYKNFTLYKDKKIQRVSPISNISEKGAIVFNVTSKKTERALMLLNWIQSSQQNYDLFVHGIKDRHYSLKGERIVIPDEISGTKNPYSGWIYTAFANINFERLSDTTPYPDTFMLDYKKFIEDNTRYAQHEGFYPDYRSIQADCNTRSQVYQSRLINPITKGTFDINDLDLSIDTLKSFGTGGIVMEIQKQLDAWRATN